MAPKRTKKQLDAVAKHLRGTVSATIPAPKQVRKSRHLTPAVLTTHFFDLLRQSAKNQPPTAEQLEALIVALNLPITACTYLPYVPDPYMVSSVEPERIDAQNLVRYLNLIAHCGPVHGLCAQCEALFILEKGNRKFCTKCSKLRLTYQGRKEYLKQKRNEYYWRDKEQAEMYKPKTKGQKHGTKEK